MSNLGIWVRPCDEIPDYPVYYDYDVVEEGFPARLTVANFQTCKKHSASNNYDHINTLLVQNYII